MRDENMYGHRCSRGYLVVSLWNQLENLLTDAWWCFRYPIFASLFAQSIFPLCKHDRSPDNAFMSPAMKLHARTRHADLHCAFVLVDVGAGGCQYFSCSVLIERKKWWVVDAVSV